MTRLPALLALFTALSLTACGSARRAPAPVPPPPPAPAPSPVSAVLQGELSYRARVALPAEAEALVELRDPLIPGAPPVAFTRFALNGRQVPVPFELALANIPRASGARYELRGSLWVDGRMRWVGPATSATAAPGRVGVGTLWLEPVQLSPAVVTRLRCGAREVSLERVDEVWWLRADGAAWELRPLPAASGTRHVAAGDPGTGIWQHDTETRVTVRGETYPACQALATQPGR